MQTEQQKIPSKLIYYRTPISFYSALVRDHKLRNRNFSRSISSIHEFPSFPKTISKKTILRYLGKVTTHAEVSEPDILSFRSLSCKNLKSIEIKPRMDSLWNNSKFLFHSKLLSDSLFLFSNLQSLHIQRCQDEHVLRSLRFLSQLKQLYIIIPYSIFSKKLDWQPRFQFLERLELGISVSKAEGYSFEENTFKVVLDNLTRFFTLPRLQHISLQIQVELKKSQFEELLKCLPNLLSFKIIVYLHDTLLFEEERIKHTLSQVEYMIIAPYSQLYEFSLVDKFRNKTEFIMLDKMKKILSLNLKSLEANLFPFILKNFLNLKALSFTSRELVLSMETDPSLRCPDHIRKIIFESLLEKKSSDVIRYLIQFLSLIPQLESFTFVGSISDEEDLLQFIELFKLDCFKTLKTLFIDIRFEKGDNFTDFFKPLKTLFMDSRFKKEDNFTELLDQHWRQLSYLNNLKALGLRFRGSDPFPFQTLTNSLKKLSKLEYLDLSFHKIESGNYNSDLSLLDFVVPFTAWPNLSDFSFYVPSYFSKNSKKKLKEVVKLKNLQSFVLLRGFEEEDSDALELFNKIKDMDSIQRVELDQHRYMKPTCKIENLLLDFPELKLR